MSNISDWLVQNRINHTRDNPDGTVTFWVKKMVRGVDEYVCNTEPKREGVWPNWERDIQAAEAGEGHRET